MPKSESAFNKAAAIKGNYNVKRGDLVYGLNAQRNLYLNKLIPNYAFKKDTPAFTINFYNNALVDAVLAANPEIITGMKDSPREIGTSIKIPTVKSTSANATTKGKHLLWNDYFLVGEENKKFNTSAIYAEVSENYNPDDPYFKWDLESKTTRLLFKRKSKSGLEIVARSNSSNAPRIHFVLNSLVMEEVVNKSGAGGKSIRSSELRYIYRNWDRLEGKIHFYRNYLEVPAPWVEDSALWANYKPTNRPIVKPDRDESMTVELKKPGRLARFHHRLENLIHRFRS